MASRPTLAAAPHLPGASGAAASTTTTVEEHGTGGPVAGTGTPEAVIVGGGPFGKVTHTVFVAVFGHTGTHG